MSERLEPAFEWQDDCQGKKDYDGDIIALSTRYWPRGGGFSVLLPGQGFVTNPDQGVRPSAKASIVLLLRGNDYRELRIQHFEADTEAEVKAAVEVWALAQFDSIRAALATPSTDPATKGE